ncbi:P-loop containing nucleoside triphosphate hydrolase protein [Gilbertella persicaria]|uniref:P-loop containing nucleoside triphosphate hydrolase protein n=1 Tax=Gilbertella persicaria TaxID=101096 RepID=UPI00221F0D71|nr:P-loop containing nucleoside triphosphate hydrolase protein [Gilbertella persicaria]KAI8098336.1 P-loop containing nucleoside triphosphate hydrolase protein [Gilbertella persicaria]
MSKRRIRNDSEEDEESDLPFIPSSSKRMRLDDQPEESSNGTPVIMDQDKSIEEIKPMLVGEDGFVEGSIVKITLRNFVTYDYCEIFPGPQMNMIIGPNGTGKSTIVCAIALGLGGSPSLLGRARNINEFVKTGADEAVVTIELKKVNVRNVVIQRSFRKSNNATSWRINDKTSTQKDVMAIIHGFNIQVDNLCQFLPQDRVAEFAEACTLLSPAQLLERTQIAAGKSDLHEMQKNLVELRLEEKSLIKQHQSDLSHLKALNSRNEQLERDVIRMQSRKKIEDGIKLLEAQIPLVKYTDANQRAERTKAAYQNEREKVKKAKEEVAPVENLYKETEIEKVNSTRKKNDAEKDYKQAFNKVRSTLQSVEAARENITVARKEIDLHKKKLPEREKQINECIKKIEYMEKELETPPSGDTSELEEGIREINNESNKLHLQSSDIQQQVREKNQIKYNLRGDLESKIKEKQQLENITKVRLTKLKHEFPDTIAAYEWLRQNKDQFAGRVYEPLVLHLNLKDDRYADLVESALGGPRNSYFRTFICEKQEDYVKFAAYAFEKMKWSVSINWPGEIPDNAIKTRLTPAELKERYKMDYFVSDLIQCPDPIFRLLCNEVYINMIPVALECSRELDIVNSNIFRKFAIGQTFYNVKTSIYVDVEARTQLTEQIRTIQGNMQQTDVEIKELHVEHDRIKQLLEELKHKKEDLQARKRDIQIQLQRYEKFKHRLQMTRSELEELKRNLKKTRGKFGNLKNPFKCIKLYEKRNIAHIESAFYDAKHTAARNYRKEHASVLEGAERNLSAAKKDYMIAEKETRRAMEACKEAGHELPEELDEAFKEIVTKWKEEGGLDITSEDLESKIAEEKGKAEGIRFANPHAMKHYEERKREIAGLEAKMEQNKQKLETFRNKISTIKDQWAPHIKELVERINVKFQAAFRRIHCEGQISVDESPDFDRWGINIYVKFRDNEKLQLLTGQRQSGGERSVTTILYLMSLQDLAKSPFRVVDEINQGMDPRNERMIHEQIVKGASRPGTSQYFLITPKLLPDLYYNERVRVLCIYNSEWLPEKIKPLSEYLNHARQTKVA